MSTVIEIYPRTARPKWLKMGALVEVLGEGGGVVHRITEIDDRGSKAAVCAVQSRMKYSWWESWTKLSPYNFNPERVSYAIDQLEASLRLIKAAQEVGAFKNGDPSRIIQSIDESAGRLRKIIKKNGIKADED